MKTAILEPCAIREWSFFSIAWLVRFPSGGITFHTFTSPGKGIALRKQNLLNWHLISGITDDIKIDIKDDIEFILYGILMQLNRGNSSFTYGEPFEVYR